jgi:hypothetical protein
MERNTANSSRCQISTDSDVPWQRLKYILMQKYPNLDLFWKSNHTNTASLSSFQISTDSDIPWQRL